MFYRHGGSFIGTLPEGNKWVKAFQSPKLEFIVNQDCWWCGETRYADIILPACTNLERNDSDSATAVDEPRYIQQLRRVIVYMQKCIDPWESKSDYWIYSQLAERLGVGREYSEDRSEEQWIKRLFEWSDLHKVVSWDEFKSKGYYLVPMPESYKPTPSLRWFYEGRDCDTPDLGNPKRGTNKGKELSSFSGKIEFASQSLKNLAPDNPERPLIRYIPSWEGHESKEITQRYPLQLIPRIPAFNAHAL
jgi:trimethylamine-N-oxide reductase (cytochrome c)